MDARPPCPPGAGPAASLWVGGIFLCGTNSRLWPLGAWIQLNILETHSKGELSYRLGPSVEKI